MMSLFLRLSNCSAPQKKTYRIAFLSPSQKEVIIHAELACTKETIEKGLMFRTSLGKDRGMIFALGKEGIHGFWMKDTPIPLDIIHVNRHREVVGILENTKPFDTTLLNVPYPSIYAIEVNAFFSRTHGIDIHWNVEFLDELVCDPS